MRSLYISKTYGYLSLPVLWTPFLWLLYFGPWIFTSLAWAEPEIKPVSVNRLIQTELKGVRQAQAAQAQVEKISQQTADLLQRYQAVIRQQAEVDFYNAQLHQKLAIQQGRIEKLKATIENAKTLPRALLPLAAPMLRTLEQFIAQDLPFHLKERQARVAQLQQVLAQNAMTSIEPLSQLFNAYQIEMNYGRTLEHYQEHITLKGQHYQVNIVRVGRLALLFQTPDRQLYGFWHPEFKRWQLSRDSRLAHTLEQGMRMAHQAVTTDLFMVPVVAPKPVVASK